MARRGLDGKAEQWTGDCHRRHPTVVDSPMGEQSEGEQSQQWSVGVTAKDVDGIDDARGVDGAKQEDKGHEDGGYGHVRPLAEPLVARPLEEVDTHARRQRRQRTVGAGEARSHNAYGEEHDNRGAQLP